MKPLEKINLIDKIARQLQKQMTYTTIETFFIAYGINCEGYEPSSNSKRVYVEEILRYVNDEIILKIADELEIESTSHPYRNGIATFWKEGYFKIFISHISKHKDKAMNLKKDFHLYGISAFVAHEDIEPSKEWQEEIGNALHSMDALTVILTEGIKDSEWCDQEIGFAVGKDVLIIPIQKGEIPYGFIGKYQAIQGNGKTVRDVTELVFSAIINNQKTRNNMFSILSSLTASSTDLTISFKRLEILLEEKDIPVDILEQMAEKIQANKVLSESDAFIAKTTSLLKIYGIDFPKEEIRDVVPEINIDEIPF